MPVYKEGLNAVIKPTIMSIKAAISTYERQGGTANIFVNDGMSSIETLGLELTTLDGMQLLPEEEASKRQDFYDEHNIGWVARPKQITRPKKPDAEFDESTVFLRKGRFKKASNMNYALMVSNRVEDKLANISRHPRWTKENENEVYAQCFQEVLEELNGRAWAAGNIRVGDYILIIDSDTRVPEDCLLDAASEMEQSPEVAIIQFSSGVMNMTTSFFEASRVFPASHARLACKLLEKPSLTILVRNYILHESHLFCYSIRCSKWRCLPFCWAQCYPAMVCPATNNLPR